MLSNFIQPNAKVLLSVYYSRGRTVAVILVANLALADFLFSCTMPLWERGLLITHYSSQQNLESNIRIIIVLFVKSWLVPLIPLITDL